MNKQDLIPVQVQEECAEVIQAISKVFRFGLNQVNCVTGLTNKRELAIEIGQLQYMLDLLSEEWDLSGIEIDEGYTKKAINYTHWLTYFDQKPAGKDTVAAGT